VHIIRSHAQWRNYGGARGAAAPQMRGLPPSCPPAQCPQAKGHLVAHYTAIHNTADHGFLFASVNYHVNDNDFYE